MTSSRRRSELLRTHLREFTRLLQHVEGGEVRAIHRTRVATRRLRELVPVLQLDPAVCARLLRDLRRATRALGRVRELDVTAQLLGQLPDEPGEVDAALSLVRDRLRALRRVVHGREVKKQRLGADLRRLGKRLERAVPTLDRRGARERQRWRWALQARVVRRAERLAAAIRDAGPFYRPESLHAVRIAAKKLRYALELDGEAGHTVPPELVVMRRAQILLGDLHDRQRLIDRLREAQAELAPGDRRVFRQLDSLVARLEDECRVFHARYVRRRQRILDACARLMPPAPAPVVTAKPRAVDAPPTRVATTR